TIPLGPAYYVDGSNGNDDNPGTLDRPFQTIAKSVSVLAAGDTLYIRSGTYPEGIDSTTMTLPSGTSWSNTSRIAAYPGETVIVAGIGLTSVQYLVIDGIISDSASAIGEPHYEALYIDREAHHIRVQNGV